jgi:hypothetical protein
MREKKKLISSKPEKAVIREVPTYSGQILEQADDDDDNRLDGGEGGEGEGVWFDGKLKFKKHIDDQYRNATHGVSGSDGRNAEDYSVADPRKARLV